MDAPAGPNQNPVRPEDGSQFDGREFHNLDDAPAGGSLTAVLRWKLLGKAATRWPVPPAPDHAASALPDALPPGEMAATFVGHSTFLLQFGGGLNVLTDPIWSERASPVAFAGPRRARPPALDFEALPPITLVLVSHGHYDHLDLPTLRRLEKRFQPLFVTGLRQGALLRKIGLRRVVELDWWQTHRWAPPAGDNPDAALGITFTPAQHWTSRTGSTRNRALWGGFWLKQAGLDVVFAGDSALGRHFALIRERLGPPAVAFLPIGAYEPRWFMQPQHMNPDDAVRAHLALGTRRSIGMHFGTFQLTDEGIDEPARALAASLQTHRVPSAEFQVPRFGETLRFESLARRADAGPDKPVVPAAAPVHITRLPPA